MDEPDSVRVTPPHVVATLTLALLLSRATTSSAPLSASRARSVQRKKTANVHEPPADDGLMHVHRYCAEPLPLCATSGAGLDFTIWDGTPIPTSDSGSSQRVCQRPQHIV